MPSGGTGIREIQCCDQPEFANHYPVPPEPSWDGCYTIDAGTHTDLISPSLTYTGFNIIPDKFLVGNITPPLLNGHTVLAALYEATALPPTYTVTVQTDVEVWIVGNSYKLQVTQGGTMEQATATASGLTFVGTPPTIVAQTLTIPNVLASYPAFTAIVSAVGTYTLCIIPA